MKTIFVSEFVEENPKTHAFTKRVRSLARELSRNGPVVDVLSPEPVKLIAENGSIKELSSSILKLRSQYRVSYIARLVSKTLFALSLLRIFRRDRPESVVVSFHSPFIGFLSTIAGKIASNRVVFDVHDSWIILEQTHPGEARNAIRMWLEHLSLVLATGITTVSDTLRDLIVGRYHVNQNKISVIYNGADVPQVAPSVKKDIDIIHLGSPRVYYNTTAFIEALGAVSDSNHRFTVVFLGCRNDIYVSQVKDKVRGFGLENHVRLLPPVEPDEVGGWLARSKIAVYTISDSPVYSSALGLKFFEYMSYGLPIAYLGPLNTEVSKSVISNGVGFAASTVQEFAKGLTELLLDDGKREVLGVRAREVATEYSWERNGQRMAAILRVT